MPMCCMLCTFERSKRLVIQEGRITAVCVLLASKKKKEKIDICIRKRPLLQKRNGNAVKTPNIYRSPVGSMISPRCNPYALHS
jgi:hypothetical protein